MTTPQTQNPWNDVLTHVTQVPANQRALQMLNGICSTIGEANSTQQVQSLISQLQAAIPQFARTLQQS